MQHEEDWPILQFSEFKGSILGKFSDVAGESVCQAVVKELVENVDRPTISKNTISVVNDSELEWIMQVINHALDLPFSSVSTYQTLSAAVRIYLAWMTSLTVDEQHTCCPEPLKMHPDRYFRKMIEAFRAMFVSKTQPLLPDTEAALKRQACEIRTVLAAIRHLTRGKVKDDFKDEVWSRSMLFLMAVCDQLLSSTKSQDEIGCLMSADLCQTLFDCWVEAALQEFVPSPSYWRTLSTLSWRWIPHVASIECWARKLLPLTVLVVQQLHGPGYCRIAITDNKLVEVVKLTSNDESILGKVWLKLFQLLGNPAHFFKHSEKMLEKISTDPVSLTYFNGQISLSFFLATVAFCKVVDIFYGDPNVSIDFHECEELYAQWQDACASLASQEDSRVNAQQNSSDRSSNLSSTGAGILSSQLSDLQTSLAAPQMSLSQPTTPMPPEAGHQHPLLHHKKSVFSTKSEKNRLPNRAQQMAQPSSQKSRIIDSTPSVPQLRAGQYVWWYMFENKVRRPYKPDECPSSTAVLEVFLHWLSDPAMITLSQRHINKYSEDVVSQKSVNSFGEATDHPPHLMTTPSTFARSSSNAGANGQDVNDRRSFATQSTASSGDISSPIGHTHSTSVFDYPSVDGVAAGRAAALGQLCRIVCAKSSKEQLPNEQLAQFYLILHEALLDRDRLMLCSLIYYSVDLFKLGLAGVEILLPNYLMAMDIVLTESQKLRLHPSVHEVEMRNACLRALASVLTWPSTFGRRKIIAPNTSPKFTKSSSTNVLESDLCYIDLRSRILRMLVHTLRNETDSANIHLTLSLCFVFCVENARYDISKIDGAVLKEKKQQVTDNMSTVSKQINSSVDEDESEKYFTISALRGVVSAVCDNLSKIQWASDLPTCLAALDCLNALATLPHSILIHQKELSTGSLIVSSLCRFVDMQLQKPPMFHSRDLHSSIVAAYYSLGTWLCAAPQLAEIESSLSTVAQIIEFGMTGGKALAPENYKPASQRVRDAAENLLETLFSDLKKVSRNSTAIDDETNLLRKFGKEDISLDNFQYFLLGENTIIGLHEAQHIHVISNGLPTVLAVFRTPFGRQHSSYFQLVPKISKHQSSPPNAQSPGSCSASSVLSEKGRAEECQDENKEQNLRSVASIDKLRSSDSFSSLEPIKQFEFPAGINKPQCKLDAEFQALDALDPIPEVTAIQDELKQIRLRLDKGAGSAVGDRDSRNVWIQSSLGAFLSQPPKPEDPVAKCDSLRVFLYDMGFINRQAFGKQLLPLNTTNIDFFRQSLHSYVDRTPVKLLETVSVFYVKDGQRSTAQILSNNINLQATSAEFCSLVYSLGKAVDVECHAHWTGHWNTAFLGERVKSIQSPTKQDHYTLDGTKNGLWWANNQIEVAYVLPTEHSKRPTNIAISNGTKFSSSTQTVLSSPDSGILETSTTPSRNSDVSTHNLSPVAIHTDICKSARTKSSSTVCSEKRNSMGLTAGDKPTHKRSSDQRIFVVWLECIEDMYYFPHEQLFGYTEDGSPNCCAKPDYVIIFLHMVEPGLVRIQTDGMWTKYGQPGPLMDGMIVSNCCLAALIQQTVCSIARRKVIEIDNYQMMHTRRRHSIFEFGKKFSQKNSYNEFLEKFIV